VEVVKRGRKNETKIVYALSRSSGRWMVYDVLTNEVSLARNYRRSFGRIMRRDGYKGLIRKMKRKIRKLNRR
jgi:ABC-type transporter MlaC component